MEKDDAQLTLLSNQTDDELCTGIEKASMQTKSCRRSSCHAKLFGRKSLVALILALSVFVLYQAGFVSNASSGLTEGETSLALASECLEVDFKCKVEKARAEFDLLQKKQSKTPEEAVMEYRRRYAREPPAGFDKWLELAFAHNATLIDEYDRIEADLQPFREAKIGHKRMQRRLQAAIAANKVVGVEDDFLGYVHVKNGSVELEGFPWGSMGQGMLNTILQPVGRNLPDLTILKNYYTEPRVLLKHNSEHSEGSDSVYFEDFARQKTWDTLSESCHNPVKSKPNPNLRKPSPATDICQYEASTMRQQHGFFVAPLHFYPTSTLIPLLSNAKISTMSDILVPNLCYASDEYRKFKDTDLIPFKDKKKSVYWRGTTTGMYHTMDNWKQGHRERFVSAFQQLNQTITTIKEHNGQAEKYERVDAALEDDLSTLLGQMPDEAINVAFSKTLGCDDETCKEMKKRLRFTAKESAASEFSHQLLGDVDGQGMSCRFYRQLSSNGLPIKHTIYQEWHDDRIIPWLHYVPLSLHMDELPRLLAWLLNTDEGQAAAEEIAQEGRQWAEKALRPIDVTLYYYRVLLEYAPIFNTVKSRLARPEA
jgi:hypothetical protein